MQHSETMHNNIFDHSRILAHIYVLYILIKAKNMIIQSRYFKILKNKTKERKHKRRRYGDCHESEEADGIENIYTSVFQ